MILFLRLMQSRHPGSWNWQRVGASPKTDSKGEDNGLKKMAAQINVTSFHFKKPALKASISSHITCEIFRHFPQLHTITTAEPSRCVPFFVDINTIDVHRIDIVLRISGDNLNGDKRFYPCLCSPLTPSLRRVCGYKKQFTSPRKYHNIP